MKSFENLVKFNQSIHLAPFADQISVIIIGPVLAGQPQLSPFKTSYFSLQSPAVIFQNFVPRIN